MKIRTILATTLCAAALLSGCAQDEAAAPANTTPPAATEMATTDDAVVAASREQLDAMRSQIDIIDMAPDTSFLSDEEREVVNLLNQTANLMSEIYIRQVSEQNPGWRMAIADSGSADTEPLLNMFDLHFGPWDTLNENTPFFGDTVRPDGAAFYPADMSREEFEAWIEAHPEDREAFTSGYTVIRRTDDGGLTAIPYAVHYREWLEPAAALLRQASEVTTNESLKTFLSLRADSFLSDDYFESEMAWMDLDGAIEVAIGPYEVYTDGLFGYKTAYEAFVTIKNPDESAALDKYKGMLRDMEANLPVSEDYKNFKRGFESPIAVVDQVYSGGDAVPGVQTVAFNLPNDERVREVKGAKKVLLNNVLGAKFDRILAPMAEKVLVADQARLLMRKHMVNEVLFHELSHSLGPGTITKSGVETTVNAELKELYSAMEEGKADVMGAYNVLYMMQLGELSAAEKENFLATYFVGLFRAMRFGINAAHGKGAAYQYSFLKEQDAFSTDEATGKYVLDFAKLEQAISDLTAKVVMVQGDGDYDQAAAFLNQYGLLDEDATRIIGSMSDIPVDIQPIYPEKI